MSCLDLLVELEAGIIEGEGGKTTNKSFRLAGGAGSIIEGEGGKATNESLRLIGGS